MTLTLSPCPLVIAPLLSLYFSFLLCCIILKMFSVVTIQCRFLLSGFSKQQIHFSEYKNAQSTLTPMCLSKWWHHYCGPLLSFSVTAKVEADAVVRWSCQAHFMTTRRLDLIMNRAQVKLCNELQQITKGLSLIRIVGSALQNKIK